MRGRLRRPLLEHLAPRHRAERVVNLDRGQPLGIVRKHFGARELGGIEAAQPFLVAEARGADTDYRRHVFLVYLRYLLLYLRYLYIFYTLISSARDTVTSACTTHRLGA